MSVAKYIVYQNKFRVSRRPVIKQLNHKNKYMNIFFLIKIIIVRKAISNQHFSQNIFSALQKQNNDN